VLVSRLLAICQRPELDRFITTTANEMKVSLLLPLPLTVRSDIVLDHEAAAISLHRLAKPQPALGNLRRAGLKL